MEEAHKYPEVVPTVNPKDWPKTLKTVEEYIRGFLGVDGQPLSYILRDGLIYPVTASDPTYNSNGSYYFTHDEEMIDHGSIRSGPAALVIDPEVVGPFTDLFIIDRALIWYKMGAIFQGSDMWKYLNPCKKHCDVRMGYKLIYNH